MSSVSHRAHPLTSLGGCAASDSHIPRRNTQAFRADVCVQCHRHRHIFRVYRRPGHRDQPASDSDARECDGTERIPGACVRAVLASSSASQPAPCFWNPARFPLLGCGSRMCDVLPHPTGGAQLHVHSRLHGGEAAAERHYVHNGVRPASLLTSSLAGFPGQTQHTARSAE